MYLKVGEALSNITAPEDKGHFMCSVNLKYVSPGWVRSESGAWHVVIQSLQWDIAQVGSDNLTSKVNFISCGGKGEYSFRTIQKSTRHAQMYFLIDFENRRMLVPGQTL